MTKKIIEDNILGRLFITTRKSRLEEQSYDMNSNYQKYILSDSELIKKREVNKKL